MTRDRRILAALGGEQLTVKVLDVKPVTVQGVIKSLIQALPVGLT